MANDLLPEQKTTLELEVLPLANKVIVVKNQEDRALVVADIRSAELLAEKIEERFHPTANKVTAYRAYEQALDTEKQFYNPINAFIKKAKEIVKSFDTSETLRIQREAREAEERQRQKEREEQAKRDAELKAAQEEADRKAVEEFQRIEAEKQKNLELQKQAEAAGNTKVAGIAAKEVAKLEGEEQKVQAEHEETVAKIEQKKEEPLPTFTFKTTPQAAQAKKLVWKAKVINPLLACQSVGAGLIPTSAVEFKASVINDLGKSYVEGQKVPGIQFYQETSGRI